MEWQDRYWYIACSEVGARWVCTFRHNPEWARRLVTLFWHINTSGDREETEGCSVAQGEQCDQREIRQRVSLTDGWEDTSAKS